MTQTATEQSSFETLNVPGPGTLVTVRRRQWVVDEVRKSSLPVPVVGPEPHQPMHLVTLTSVEDDALGEELQVIWEVEPGAAVHENLALPEPDGFDPPERLQGFLDAVRWGAVISADRDLLQAPFRSGVEMEEYQLEPVVRCLEMPRVSLLLADDVGLGKTIETGLVVQELILRNRVRSVLVLCPASLCVQWREQMRDKFGLEFRIVDRELMHELRKKRGIHTNPWTHFPRLIASLDFFKRERTLRRFCEALPNEATYPRTFDMLIVDEAHNVAPSGIGHYAVDSQRTKAVQRIIPHFEHKLFLTATPHNGYQESFTALLELLDDQRFQRGMEPDRKQLGAVMVRRLKTDIREWDGTRRFAERVLEPLEVDYSEPEREAHRLLRRYTELRQRATSDGPGRTAADFVLKLLKKRLFSSPMAFLRTLETHRATMSRGFSKPRSTVRPSIKILKARMAGLEDDFGDDEAYEETTTELLEATSDCLPSLSSEEEGVLDQLLTWARQAGPRADSKARTLLDWLKATLKPQGSWSSERAIIFTEYRDTQKWLQDHLALHNLAGEGRLLTLYGGMATKDREAIKAAFQTHPNESEVRILLATDAASEGIDLQNHCHLMVHYEIPWNPNRLEQRNGRIDRHGQKHSEVLIHHFVGRGFQKQQWTLEPGQLEGDLEFLMRAALKVQAIREDLGKVGPVIAQQVEEAMLGTVGRRRLDTDAAERKAALGRQALKVERELRALEEVKERLKQSRTELRVEAEHVHTVVNLGLELGGQPALLPGLEARTYRLPQLLGNWGRSYDGLYHPHTGKVRSVTFHHELVKGRDDLVLIHLNHPLVQRSLRLLRGEIWKPEGEKKIFRVTARRVPDHLLQDPVVLAHARLVVLGGDSHCLHEELLTAGGQVVSGRLRRLGPGALDEALGAASATSPAEDVLERLKSLWPELRPALQAALEARQVERTRTLQTRLDRRMNREVQDMEAILTELDRRIRKSVTDLSVPEQLDLFEPEEKDQWRRDRDLLRQRAERIPEEIEKEKAAIQSRYRDPVPRLFPVAVTWLMPERLCR